MKTELITLADKIRANRVKPKDLANLSKYAKRQNMCLTSVALKDGTSAKILMTPNEVDCLIMKNGKVLTARGIKDNAINIMGITSEIFNHMIKRNRAISPSSVQSKSNELIDNFFIKFANEVKEFFG